MSDMLAKMAGGFVGNFFQTVLSPLRVLARLFASVPGNPIVIYGAPWKRSVVHRLVFLLFLGYPFGLWWLGIQFSENIWTAGNSTLRAAYLAGFVTLLTLLAMSAAIAIFSVNFRQPGRLEDLYLSRLSERESAFGSVFWGAAIAGYCLMGTFITLWLYADRFPAANTYFKSFRYDYQGRFPLPHSYYSVIETEK